MAQGIIHDARGAPSADRRRKSGARTALAVALIAVAASAQPIGPEEARTVPNDTARGAGPASGAVNDLQRQLNDLRSDLLDEREKRIVGWQESHGTALVALGIAIGIGGLWAYAKFRAIATVAATGIAAERGHAFSSWDALPQPGTAPVSPGQPVRLLVPAGPEAGSPAAIRHDPGSRHAVPDPADVPDSPEDQEALAESTEAIRLDPDHPHAWIERGDLKAKQRQYEGAIADYDQAIRLDPRNAGAYLNRSLAKSELGRHDEALADLDQAMRLDPDMTSTLGDL